MLERLGNGCGGEPLRGPVAEGPAGGGEDEPPDGVLTPRDALQDGAVLRVDRHQLAAALGRGPPDQLPRDHQ